MGGEGEVGLFGRHLVDWQVVLTLGERELWMAGWTLVFGRSVVVFLVATCMNVTSTCRSGYVYLMTCMRGLLGSCCVINIGMPIEGSPDPLSPLW